MGKERGEWNNLKIEKIRKIIGAFLLVSLISLGFYQPFKDYLNIPTDLVLFEDQHFTLPNLPLADVVNANANIVHTSNEEALSVYANESGDDQLLFEANGFPIKNVNVKVLPDLKVIPGGQSIGVKLNTLGVLVVGHHQVATEEGKKSPGEMAGIEVGDIITKINGEKIEKMSDVTPFVQESGKSNEPLTIIIKRENKEIKTKLTPLKDKNDHAYRIGLYIRDSAAGIGTMTFYHPNSHKYGALGHVISDMDTKKPIVVENGQIVKSTVTSIEKGSNGNPGEKLARFSEDKEIIGTITKNSPYGIFGTLKKHSDNGVMDEPIPVALSSQVKIGPAKILTVVNNDKVEAFDIEVVSTVPQKFPATKGLVIKVTDPELLAKTGGIVQGMSGSPIIQNGRLIGAVTHVFVNDSTSGYGVHIEWMLDEAGIDIYGKENKKAS